MNSKKDRRQTGSSILMVIITMAMVGMLAMVVMAATLTNLQMKSVDAKAQNNFYTAETALDEINAGLQAIAGQAASEAYTYVLERYSLTQAQDDKRLELFKKVFLEKLQLGLQTSDRSSKFDVLKLEQYLETTKWDVATGTGAKLQSDDADLMVLNDKDNTAVILKKLKVTYKDDRGFTSIIQTDIRIGVPDITFTQSASMPDIMKYALIANKKLTSSANARIVGSVYGGKEGMTISGGEFSVEKADRVITNANLIVKNGAFVQIGKDDDETALWVDGIQVGFTAPEDTKVPSTLTLNCKTFLADDLIVSGAGNQITLKNEYYGYGNPVTAKASLPNTDTDQDNKTGQAMGEDDYIYMDRSDPDMSSAIIINGRKTTMDLSGLNRLLLSGNAYIGTKKIPDTNFSIPTGESLSVKSNQLAYLVPQECFVISSSGNPMSNEKYNKLCDGKTITDAVNFDKKISKLDGKSLKELGVTGVQPVFVPTSGKTVVYVYLTFNQPAGEPPSKSMEAAANYFQMYYKEIPNKAFLDRYLNAYAEKLAIDENDPGNYNRFTASGNLMGAIPDEKDENKVSGNLIHNTIGSPEGKLSLAEEEKGYQSIFFALGKKLVPNYSQLKVSEKKKDADVFGNLIDKTKFNTISNKIFTTAVSEMICVLSRSNITISALSNHEKVRLLVTAGDVTVDTDFTGTIIAGGTINITNGAVIQAAPEAAAKVFQAVDADGDSPTNYFKDGSKYVLNGAGSGKSSGQNTYIALTELISYENWSKQ